MKRVQIQVTPEARRERFVETKPDVFEAKVKEEAAGNMANTRIRELVAQHFGVDPKKVRIETGHRSHKKTLCIIDI